MTLQVGQVLNGRYRIDGQLGQGGFGAVYKAWDLSLERACAVKENLDTSDDARRQFTREATVLASLSHPNLPRVTDHFFVPGYGQYLVMDFVDGADLRQLLNAQGPLPVERALDILRQVCDALEYLHSRQPPVLHRDIKPANIKITPEGKAVLVDFGLVKMYGPQLETTGGAQAVTPGYSPPEQYGRGITDARSDIYALAATLYSLLTARLPPESVQRYGADALTLPHELNDTIPPVISAAIGRGMALNPSQRFQSVAELRKVFFPDTTVKAPPARSMPLGGLWVVTAIVILILCLGLAGVLTLGGALALPILFNTPTPMFTATAPGVSLLLQDDFSNPSGGWGIGTDKGGTRAFVDGQYDIRVTQPNWNFWSTAAKLGLRDLHAEVTAQVTDAASDAGFGLLCDYVDVSHFYFLGMTSDGYYAIIRLNGSDERALSDPSGQWVQTTRFTGGETTYRVGADCGGDGTLTLYVNSQPISSVQDQTFTSGQIGLFVRSFKQVPAEVRFDDLIVKSLH